MLYKKELTDIPVGKMPEIDAAGREFVATAQVVELKRSGKILVVDFFNRKEKQLSHRFCSDGKNYCTMNVRNGNAWTEQNPRVWVGYSDTANRLEDEKLAAEFLHRDRYHRHCLISIVDNFISSLRWDRREKAYDNKVALRTAHFAMYPPLPDNLASYCESHLFTPYIFISPLDKKGHRQGRCSHCNAEFEAPRVARSGQLPGLRQVCRISRDMDQDRHREQDEDLYCCQGRWSNLAEMDRGQTALLPSLFPSKV